MTVQEAATVERAAPASAELVYTDKRAKLHYEVNAEEAAAIGTRYQSQVEQIDGAEQRILFDERGRPRLQSEEAARQRAKFNGQRQDALQSFRARIAETEANSQQLLAEVEAEEARYSGDPLEYLSADELQLATARDSWIRRDATEMGLEALAARIRSAIARQDRPALALWLRYGSNRLEAERAAAAERGEFVSRPGPRAALAEALSSAEAALVDAEALARRKALAERRSAAEGVLAAVRSVRLAVDPEARADLGRRWGIST